MEQVFAVWTRTPGGFGAAKQPLNLLSLSKICCGVVTFTNGGVVLMLYAAIGTIMSLPACGYKQDASEQEYLRSMVVRVEAVLTFTIIFVEWAIIGSRGIVVMSVPVLRNVSLTLEVDDVTL